jgi:hypothetical protein
MEALLPAIDRSPLAAIQQPYPGLRAFETYESFLFFGREIHTEELLRRLSGNRFLAVVGTSGGGKSSLVRAGLLPALCRGYLVGATSQWRVAVMRPGSTNQSTLTPADAEVLGTKTILPGEDPSLYELWAGAGRAKRSTSPTRKPLAGGGPIRGALPLRG